MSGPLHGGAPARVLPMIEEVERTGDAGGLVTGILDREERLMGFGHRVYRAEDPRARVLRRTCRELDAPRYEAAAALEQAALTELRERRPDRAIETNVEFWAAVILDFAGVPPHDDAGDVHLRPHGRLVGAHPGAEAGRAGWCGRRRSYIGPAPRTRLRSRDGRRSPTPEGVAARDVLKATFRAGDILNVAFRRPQARYPAAGAAGATRATGRFRRIDSDSTAPSTHSTAPPYQAAS